MIYSYISLYLFAFYVILFLLKAKEGTMLLERLKIRKYKEILFVDSENVGYQIPLSLPQNVLIYLFISCPDILHKQTIKNYKQHQQVQIIDLSSIIKKQMSTKNAMDFCLMTKVAEMIKMMSSRQKIIILSKDKGYDAALSFLKKEHQHLHIERYPLSLLHYFHTDKEAQRIISHIDTKTYNEISKHTNMIELKKYLHKKQRQLFIVSSYQEPISHTNIYLEYDIYTQNYALYYSGTYKKQYSQIREAKKAYQTMIHEVNHRFQKYQSQQLYIKAKKLKIQIYIEEAALKNLPLQDCLIQHLGDTEGNKLFNEYINSSSSLDNRVHL